MGIIKASVWGAPHQTAPIPVARGRHMRISGTTFVNLDTQEDIDGEGMVSSGKADGGIRSQHSHPKPERGHPLRSSACNPSPLGLGRQRALFASQPVLVLGLFLTVPSYVGRRHFFPPIRRGTPDSLALSLRCLVFSFSSTFPVSLTSAPGSESL